jgi:hypothetical protein
MATAKQIDALIDRLTKLVKALEKGGGSGGGAASPGSQLSPAGSSDSSPGGFFANKKDAAAAAEALANQIRLLENKKRGLEELEPAEERALVRAKEELEIKERQAAAKSWKQYKQEEDALRSLSEARQEAADAVDEEAEALEKLHEEYEVGAEKAKLLTDGMFQFGGAAQTLARYIPTTTGTMTGMANEMFTLEFAGKTAGKAALALAAESLNLAMATDKSAAAFRRQTGAADTSAFGEYGMAMSSVRDQTAIFGGTHEDAAAAMGSLYTEMSAFTQLSKDTKVALTAQSVALDALGVSNSDTSQIFDTATKSLGLNESQLVGLTERLHDTAQSLGKSTKQVFADFNAVSKKLAFYGEDVIDVFEKLEKQSKATGLTVDQLVGVAGQAFDTFDGAGQKVGRLNAILGGPYLNSIDMLNASEGERLEMLTDSVEMSGQLFSDMNKYEQLAIADALGVDVDTARRMFGELSAAEELQIKHQEEIAETAREAQDVLSKLKNAFYSLITALDIIIQPIAWIIEGFSMIIGSLSLLPPGAQKAIKSLITLIAVIYGLKYALGALKKSRALIDPAGGVRGMATRLKDRLTGGGKMHGPDLPPGGLPGTETSIPDSPTGDTTSRWESFTEGIKELGEAVKGTWKEMLAFGAAILMIGGGIALAAMGLAKLVEAFQHLEGGQIAGAVLALVVVGALFAGMLYILATASLTAVGPMIALGVAFLLIGAGIYLAALGLVKLVGAFGLLIAKLSEIPPVLMFQLALSLYALSGSLVVLGVGLVAAGIGAAIALIPLMLIIGPLLGLAVAVTVMGLGMKMAGEGLAILVAQLVQIPADQIFATARAFGALGMSLVTFAYGAYAAVVGLGVLAAGLLLAAYPLIIGSTVLGIFSGALMLVGIGMNLVAAGAENLKTSILTFVTILPQVLAFSAALMGIGAAALGILATAAALAYLTPAMLAFAGATKVIGLKKLEALTEFNKSATLTVDTVYKPDTNEPGREATEKAMSGKTEATPFPWPSDERLSTAAQAKDSPVSKPVINFSPKSIIVKIGDTELKDIVLQVLNEQVSFNSR